MREGRWLNAAAIVTWLICGLSGVVAIAQGAFGGWPAVAWIAAYLVYGVVLFLLLEIVGARLVRGRYAPLVLSGIQVPRMNAIMERWVRTGRRELLDRTLIRNQRHLLHALREYERFYNLHRPHQGIANARPLKPLPEPITDPDQLTRLNIHRRDRLGGVLHEYEHAA